MNTKYHNDFQIFGSRMVVSLFFTCLFFVASLILAVSTHEASSGFVSNYTLAAVFLIPVVMGFLFGYFFSRYKDITIDEFGNITISVFFGKPKKIVTSDITHFWLLNIPLLDKGTIQGSLLTPRQVVHFWRQIEESTPLMIFKIGTTKRSYYILSQVGVVRDIQKILSIKLLEWPIEWPIHNWFWSRGQLREEDKKLMAEIKKKSDEIGDSGILGIHVRKDTR